MSGGNKCKVVWEGHKVVKAARGAILDALLDVAEDAVTHAQNRAPLETGVLRNSGRVTIGAPPDPGSVYEEEDSGGGKVTVKPPEKPTPSDGDELVVYASFSTPYALKLHEDLKWKPRAWRETAAGKIVPRTPVGGPKYLENSVPKAWGKFNKRLADAMRRHGVT
jgi:hypothetical protein